ncbi:MAG: signal peptidase II [Calditrichaeota bacterium]|nr:signal peptidase II [Calditrichota bacterium]
MKNLRILWIPLFVLILDQATKLTVKATMELYQSIPILGNFFRLTFVENSGMAFGISIRDNTFFTVFSIIASFAILIYLFNMRGEHIYVRVSMAVIFGGAIGNLTDRLIRGRVVDFLDFEFFDIHIPAFHFLFINFPGYSMTRWPVFNVADMAVTIGMVMLFIFILQEKPNKDETIANASETEMIR